jgi:hypothetical protein
MCHFSTAVDGRRLRTRALPRLSSSAVISTIDYSGGGNSVGRALTLSGQHFTVIGILAKWLPLPCFYDEARDFGPPDDLFIPFRWLETIAGLTYEGFCYQTKTMLDTFRRWRRQSAFRPAYGPSWLRSTNTGNTHSFWTTTAVLSSRPVDLRGPRTIAWRVSRPGSR